MMTFDEIQAHLAQLTWPEGMSVIAHQHPHEGLYLRTVWTTVDSFDSGRTVDLGSRDFPSVNDTVAPEALDRYLAQRLVRRFAHEALEQFQRDGRPVIDPHGEVYYTDVEQHQGRK